MSNTNIEKQSKSVIPMDIELIEVDENFNVRKEMESKNGPDGRGNETIAKLAATLKREGQLTPVIVRPGKKSGTYQLVSGFRRMAAAKELGWTTIRAQIEESLDAEQAYFVNLIENTARKDLTTYELAARCSFISQRFKLEGAKIAQRLGYGKKYVNSLIQCFRDLPKEITEKWAEGVGICNMHNLRKWVSMSKAEALNAYRVASGEKAPSEGSGSGSGTAPKGDEMRLRSKKVILAFMAHIKDKKYDSTEEARAAKSAYDALAYITNTIDVAPFGYVAPTGGRKKKSDDDKAEDQESDDAEADTDIEDADADNIDTDDAA